MRFLTDPGDLVLDPFAGSLTTGEAAEREERRWLAFEIEPSYVVAGKFRFGGSPSAAVDLTRRHGELSDAHPTPTLFDTHAA
ncbi:MAG: DNA methyltransferase [Tepidisphaeraceae bacterium]